MIIYLVAFALSCGGIYLANRAKNRKEFFIWSVVSIAVMVLLAGLRDYSIGTDVQNYLEKKWYWGYTTEAVSLWDYIGYYLWGRPTEPLFGVLMGVVWRLTGSFRVFLFAAHFVILVCVYIGAYRQRKHANPALVMLLFYLLYFNQSLNLIRQYMAMAVVFVVLEDLNQKCWKRYFIGTAVAVLIHNSALLSLGYGVIVFIQNTKWEPITRKKWYRSAAIFGGVLLVLLLLKPLAQGLVSLGILSEKYAIYFQNDQIKPALLSTGFMCVELLTVFFFRKQMAQRSERFDFYATTSGCYFLLQQFSWVLLYGKRLSAFYAMGNLMTIGLMESAQTETKKKWLVRIGVVGVALAYWMYVYVLRNGSQTMPYRFFF